MVRKPCCSYAGMNRGLWTAEEDFRLTSYIQIHGVGNCQTLPMKAKDCCAMERGVDYAR